MLVAVWSKSPAESGVQSSSMRDGQRPGLGGPKS